MSINTCVCNSSPYTLHTAQLAVSRDRFNETRELPKKGKQCVMCIGVQNEF